MIEIKSLVEKNKKIAVLYGGMSSERDVSLRSGKNCFEALKRLGYENVSLFDFSVDSISKLVMDKIEVAYLALHGKYGEDGCVQGLLEMLGIAYTGCRVMASAIAMDKAMTKQVLVSSDINFISSCVLYSLDEIEKALKLNFPLMVKPTTEGSSIGMRKVIDELELKDALKYAFEFADKVMVEEFLVGKSVTVGVLENEGEIFATPILELRTKTEWYDFEAKYTEGFTEFILPAELSLEETAQLQKWSVEAHKQIGARGMSRVDFLVTSEKPYMLEINTIPGMTDMSDLPAQSKEMGITYDNLVQLILNSSIL